MAFSGQLHAPVALPPGTNPSTHRIGWWVGPSLGLDVLEKRKISCRDRDSNSEISSHDLKAGAGDGMRQMAHSIKRRTVSVGIMRGGWKMTVHRFVVQNAEWRNKNKLLPLLYKVNYFVRLTTGRRSLTDNIHGTLKGQTVRATKCLSRLSKCAQASE
jgi:hypothetical protein